MKAVYLIAISTLLIGCVNQRDIAQQFKLLDEVHLEKNTYYLHEANNKLFFKMNTGSQDILFIAKPSSDKTIVIDNMKKAKCFAVHYNGAVCNEGNFRVKSGRISLEAKDKGLHVEMKTTSVKVDGGLKTKADLSKLFRRDSEYQCEWSWVSDMRASLHPTR